MAKNYSPMVKDAIENFLTNDDWKFNPINENGMYRLNIALKGKLQKATLLINVRSDGFSIRIVLPMKAEDNVKAAMAEFIARANYGLYIGNFELDYSDGELSYRASICSEDIEPTFEQINSLIYTSWNTVEKYGDALVKVLFGFATAEAAVKEAEA